MRPRNEERRPAAHGTPSEIAAAAKPQDRPERSAPGPQLRRRRHAAQRCPRLEDGRRDLLDPEPLGEVTGPELAAWRAAWSHLSAHGYAVDVPPQVVAAGHRERLRVVAS